MLFCIRSSFEINSQVASSKAKQRDCQGIVDECRAGNSRKYPWQEQLKAKKCGGKENDANGKPPFLVKFLHTITLGEIIFKRSCAKPALS